MKLDMMPAESKGSQFLQKSSRFANAGLTVCGIFLGLLLVAAFVIKIGGAVVSSGHLISEGNTKLVQHREGGSVAAILVSNGEYVKKGTALLALDGKQIEADYNIARFRHIELRAKLERLNSELAGKSKFKFNWLKTGSQHPELTNAIATQESLFRANRRSHISEKRRLDKRIVSLSEEITAIDVQLRTVREQLTVVEQQLAEMGPLVEDQLIAKSREWQLVRDKLATRSQIDSIEISRLKTQMALSEARNELELLVSAYRRDLFAEIEQAEADLQQATETFFSLSDQRNRLTVTAPVSGVVHDLQTRNVGSVVRPGDTILKLVPNSTDFELDVRVTPTDIDQISVGQKTRLRFEAFDAKKTPEVFGNVRDISADRILDDATGAYFYSVKVTIADDEIAHLGAVELVSGMPVTAMFQTEERSLLSFLTRPLEQQSSRAFR